MHPFDVNVFRDGSYSQRESGATLNAGHLLRFIYPYSPSENMTPQQLVGLGVRFFAVFVALHSIEYLIRIPATMANTDLVSQAYLSYGIGAFCLATAAFLWFFPMATAHRLIPRTNFENRLTLQAFDAARVGGSLIGLWLFANAMPGVLWFLFRGAAYSASSQSIVGALDTEDKVRLAYYAAQVLLSFILVFKSHLFAALAVRNPDVMQDKER